MMKSNLAKNTILLSIGTILTKGITFIMVPIFSRWLTTEDYGTFDLLCTYVTMLIPIITLASGEGIFRFGIDEDDIRCKAKHITNGLVIYLIGLLTFGIITIFIWKFANWNLAFPFFLLLAGEVFNKYLQSYLRAIKHLNIYSFCSAISSIFIFLCVTVCVRGLGLELQGIILGYAFGYLIGDIVIVVWTKYWNYLSRDISKKEMCQLIRYSAPLIPNSISWWIINASDRTIINLILGAASNGIYAIAYKIPNLCSSIFSVFSISWQETASEIVDAADRSRYYNHVYNRMLSILFSLCGGVVSCNFIFFNWIFDSKYYTGYLYSPILVTSVLFSSMSLFFGGIQISLKQTKVNGMTNIVGAVLNILVHVLLISSIGLFAACVSTVVSTAVVMFLRQYMLRSVVKIKIMKENWVLAAIYVYLMVSAYFIHMLPLSIVNLVIACLVFVYVNQDYIVKILNKAGLNIERK